MKGYWLWCCLWVCCGIAFLIVGGATDSIDAQVRTEMAKALKAGSVTYANPQIGKSSDPGSSSTGTPSGSSASTGKPKSTNKSWIVILSLILLGMLFVVSLLIYYCCVAHPHCPNASPSPDLEPNNGGPCDGSLIKSPRSTMITIQELREGTDNFSDENILGQGGFGVVYKGKLRDGTKIAVKRMNAEKGGSKGPSEFEAEINVLTQVRHRNLVNLLGYCIEREEKILVYEYIPQGPLSQHLFEWEKAELKPLDWKQRLSIALDIAHGVQYLHNLAQESFIHRDLKPSNILLGDGMRAKLSDFGLVKLARDGIFSVEHKRIKGTFGYIAPDYADGELTTKLDVFSFGVVLMELITGRRALDESQPEELKYLAISFRHVIKSGVSGESFRNAVDPVLDMADDTFQSICRVAELARHCTAQHSSERPDMGYVVNVLSGLVHPWKPPVSEDQSVGALKRLWQTVKGGAPSSEARNTHSGSRARRIQTSRATSRARLIQTD